MTQESGTALTPNLCATALLEADGSPSTDDEATLAWAAATVMGGGLNTASDLSIKREFYKTEEYSDD